VPATPAARSKTREPLWNTFDGGDGVAGDASAEAQEEGLLEIELSFDNGDAVTVVSQLKSAGLDAAQVLSSGQSQLTFSGALGPSSCPGSRRPENGSP
jgi:hypothetical protein